MSSFSTRLRVRGCMAPSPDAFALPVVPRRPIGMREWAAACLFFAFWGGLFGLVMLVHDKVPLDEMVIFVANEPPPPPPPPSPAEPPPPPKDIEPPKPVPPDPDQPPPPPMDQPPPPQFGLPPDATSGNGDMVVATGNTLMKKPETVVKAPVAAALPAAPMQSNYDAQVVKEVAPAYPEWAIDQGVMLRIKVLISLDETGKVADVRFLNAGQKDFNENIRKAIMASVFKPLVVAGRAVPARFIKEYNFELE